MHATEFLGGTVYPYPKNADYTREEFSFGRRMVLTLPRSISSAQKTLFCELFRNFTADSGRLNIVEGNGENVAVLAKSAVFLPSRPAPDADYAFTVDCEKAVLQFGSAHGFAHAMSTLLALIEVRACDKFTLPIGTLIDTPATAMRAIHLCVFAESDFRYIHKKVREFGFLKYSHLVIEFWGTFPFACEKALGRRGRILTHRQIKTLVREANALGMEVVPMLNIWGHAAMHRGGFGKHAALDQNPKLQPYFNKTGWVWNILNPDVFTLHCRMAKELLDACGNGSYFHIGCDEASAYGEERAFCGIDKTAAISDYINRITSFLQTLGRRPMMWADMLLCEPSWAGIEQNGESPETVAYLAAHLDRNILMVDWQYGVKTQDVPSAAYLADCGFDVMLASWTDKTAQKVCCDNAARNGYVGYMQTTWDSLTCDMIFVARGAICAWTGAQRGFDEPQRRMHAVMAEFARKLLPAKGNYAASGICENELERH